MRFRQDQQEERGGISSQVKLEKRNQIVCNLGEIKQKKVKLEKRKSNCLQSRREETEGCSAIYFVVIWNIYFDF